MKAERVLVVEDDARLRELLVHQMGKAGFEVDSATDGQDALECVGRTMPDLVVTDVMMPRMDGMAFVRRFRSMPGSAFVPVVFLTALDSDEHRMKGFRMGADEYIAKPFKEADLLRSITSALERRRHFQNMFVPPASVDGPEEPPGFRGRLDQIGLATTMTMLEMERRTGALDVRRISEEGFGIVYFRSGQVVQTQIDGRPELSGCEGAYELLTWGEGTFEFRPVLVEEEDVVGTTTAALLLEAARRFDEDNVPPEAEED